MTDQTKMPDRIWAHPSTWSGNLIYTTDQNCTHECDVAYVRADLVKPPTDGDAMAAFTAWQLYTPVYFGDDAKAVKHAQDTILAALAQPVEQRFDVGKVRELLLSVKAKTDDGLIGWDDEQDFAMAQLSEALSLLDVPAPGVGDKVRRAFQAGFEVSAEGYNGECNDGDVRGYLDRGFSKFEAAYASQSKNAGAE